MPAAAPALASCRWRWEAARRIVPEALAVEGLRVVAWRDVPVCPAVLGTDAALSRPSFVQAIVERPRGASDAAFELRLVAARRRMQVVAREASLRAFAVPSASCRTVVYKGLVAGARLAGFYPDLAPPPPLGSALFHHRCTP